jgi:hypothetical protein
VVTAVVAVKAEKVAVVVASLRTPTAKHATTSLRGPFLLKVAVAAVSTLQLWLPQLQWRGLRGGGLTALTVPACRSRGAWALV